MNRIKRMRSLRSLLFLDAAHREADAAVAAVLREHARRAEVQVATARRTARRSRPAITVPALAAHRPRADVAITRSGIRSNHLLNAAGEPSAGNPVADWFFITDDNAARNSDAGHDRFYAASGLLNLQDTLPEALTSRDSGPVCLK